MNKIILVSVILVITVAVSIFALNYSGMLQLPGNGLDTFEGKLVSGISLFSNGQAIVEIGFEGGRGFVATEQLAREISMEVGKTYRIWYNATADPTWALDIQEIS